MGIFVQAVNAGKPRTIQAGQVALIYAAILIVMAVMQLFSFDKFLVLVESFWLPGGKHFAYVLAGCIVTFEVFAIPFASDAPKSSNANC